MRTPTVLILLGILILAAPASAQQSSDPFRFLIWPIEDARALGNGVGLRSAAAIGGASLGILALSSLDDRVTHRAQRVGSSDGMRFAQEFGHARVVRPALGVLLIGGLMKGDHRLQDASFTALESVLFANFITNSLKKVFGRARPWQGQGPEAFAPFSGDKSMPSGHATTAFAALTPFALYYGGVAGAGLFVLAGTTAFSRMATHAHWFSDVIAGSLIGFSTAWVLTRRHSGSGSIRLAPTPAGAGLQIRF